ncbi:MAG: type 1 glutamine amidotransferase [Candidatus Omnitrophica bacterium]|nr:type 1 glutamine amidotransferase [Candidatus Omnitrophota bacterium]
MNPVLVIQHIPIETPGLIADALLGRNITIQTIHPYRGEAVPETPAGFSALVLMGGPMGVYESGRYPFLMREVELIRKALEARLPILGVCLGSQLLAQALGARVQKGPQKEIGWYDLHLTDEAREDRIFGSLKEPIKTFLWHGDVFDVPPSARRLAYSDLTGCQAFGADCGAYGLLFHAESGMPVIEAMTREFGDELSAGGFDKGKILADSARYLDALEVMGREIFSRWAALVE